MILIVIAIALYLAAAKAAASIVLRFAPIDRVGATIAGVMWPAAIALVLGYYVSILTIRILCGPDKGEKA